MEKIWDEAIRALQKNGRASYSDIAKEIGVSREVVSEQLTKLIAMGEIRIVAAIHPQMVGIHAIAHLALKTRGEVAEIAAKLETLTSVVFMSESIGEHQIVLECRAGSLAEINREIEKVRATSGVQHVDVLLYEKIVQSLFGEEAWITDGIENLDRYDRAIIKILQRDGRAGYANISEAVGLSVSATRNRVLRLIEQNIIHISVIRRRITSTAGSAGSAGLVGSGGFGSSPGSADSNLRRDNTYLYGLGITAGYAADEAITVLKNFEGLEFLARSIGRFSIVATVACSESELVWLMRALRALSASTIAKPNEGQRVFEVESWPHVEVFIERYD